MHVLIIVRLVLNGHFRAGLNRVHAPVQCTAHGAKQQRARRGRVQNSPSTFPRGCLKDPIAKAKMRELSARTPFWATNGWRAF